MIEQASVTRSSIADLHQTVRLTARLSALLFAAAEAAPALGSNTARWSRRLYPAFMLAHAAHFAAVSRYAMVTGGRDLFPRGRSMTDVGGWPTVLGIYVLFSVLAVAGWAGIEPGVPSRPKIRIVGRAATGLIAAMFVGTYLGQTARSKWSAVPATIIGMAVTANNLAHQRREDHRRG